MKFSGAVHLPLPPARVVEALTDPKILQQSIPGCEKLERISEDEYHATLKLGVASIKGQYSGKIRIADQNFPHSFTLRMDGKGAPGFVKGATQIQLRPAGQGTDLTYDSQTQAGGLIAAVGSRIIEAIGKKLADEFFKRFAEVVSKIPPPDRAAGPAPGAPRAS